MKLDKIADNDSIIKMAGRKSPITAARLSGAGFTSPLMRPGATATNTNFRKRYGLTTVQPSDVLSSNSNSILQTTKLD